MTEIGHCQNGLKKHLRNLIAEGYLLRKIFYIDGQTACNPMARHQACSFGPTWARHVPVSRGAMAGPLPRHIGQPSLARYIVAGPVKTRSLLGFINPFLYLSIDILGQRLFFPSLPNRCDSWSAATYCPQLPYLLLSKPLTATSPLLALHAGRCH